MPSKKKKAEGNNVLMSQQSTAAALFILGNCHAQHWQYDELSNIKVDSIPSMLLHPCLQMSKIPFLAVT